MSIFTILTLDFQGKNSNPSLRKDQQGKEMIMSKSMMNLPSSLSALTNSNSITNFTWYTFDSNKILAAENALLQNLYNLTLSDTFATVNIILY